MDGLGARLHTDMAAVDMAASMGLLPRHFVDAVAASANEAMSNTLWDVASAGLRGKFAIVADVLSQVPLISDAQAGTKGIRGVTALNEALGSASRGMSRLQEVLSPWLLRAQRQRSTLSLVEQSQLSGTEQRAILSLNMGPKANAELVSHHLIPLEAQKDAAYIMRKATEGGFNINGANNGLRLRPQDHVNDHQDYNQAVVDRLLRISKKLTPADTAAAVQDIANTLRAAAMKNRLRPWG